MVFYGKHIFWWELKQKRNEEKREKKRKIHNVNFSTALGRIWLKKRNIYVLFLQHKTLYTMHETFNTHTHIHTHTPTHTNMEIRDE